MVGAALPHSSARQVQLDPDTVKPYTVSVTVVDQVTVPVTSEFETPPLELRTAPQSNHSLAQPLVVSIMLLSISHPLDVVMLQDKECPAPLLCSVAVMLNI